MLTGVPWWSAPVAGVVTYAALFVGNLTGEPLGHTLFAFAGYLVGFVALLFLAGWWRGRERRQLLEKTHDLEVLRAMPWRDFEMLVGEAYRRLGFQVTERGGGGADGGVDLELRRNGEVTLVQCKRWKQREVHVQTVRELWGVVSHERAAGAIFVTSGKFTNDAREFAAGKKYGLVDGQELLELASTVRREPQTEPSLPEPSLAELSIPAQALPRPSPTCARCGSEMIRRTGTKGRPDFWGCSHYPACRSTLPLQV